MKELVLQIVKEIEAGKAKEHIEPTHCTLMDINQAIKSNLRVLVDEGVLKAGKTINDHYVTVIEQPPTE